MYSKENVNYREVEHEVCCATCQYAKRYQTHPNSGPGHYLRCDKVDEESIIQPSKCARYYVCDLWELNCDLNKRKKALAKLTKEERELLGL